MFTGSFVDIHDERIREHVADRMAGGYQWPAPWLSLNPNFASGGTVTDLVAQGLLHPECEKIFRLKDEVPQGPVLRLHQHQREAIVTARAGSSYVLTTGTRYHTALRLAELVLSATSVEHRPGGVAVNGFLLDMPTLFEDFVTVTLREAIVPAYGGRVAGQDRHHFDEAGHVVLRPDIVWKSHGSPLAVIDAKYKAEKPAGYPNADLYQLLAYCTVLGLSNGHLIYAKGNENPAHHVVRRSGIEIICSAVDLDEDPESLLSQMHGLARRIASSQLGPIAQLQGAARPG